MICTNITNCKREGKCRLDAVNMYYKCKIVMPFILLKNVIMIQCAVKIIKLQKELIERQDLTPSIIICDVLVIFGSLTFNTFVNEN